MSGIFVDACDAGKDDDGNLLLALAPTEICAGESIQQVWGQNQHYNMTRLRLKRGGRRPITL